MKIPSWLAFIVFIALGLFLVGISGYHSRKELEGFLASAGQPAVRCGVDLATCAVGTQCINGFCGVPRPSQLPPNELPVYP